MRAYRRQCTAGLAVACGFLFLAGCDLGLEQSSNRYEQLNIEVKALTNILHKISDEASAKAHQAELQAAADKVRAVQERIREAEEKQAKSGSSGGMSRITNFRQASLFQQTGEAAWRQIARIRQTDPKAGDIVDKAVAGIELPEPVTEGPGGY